jgi:hypothetical protein
MARQELTGLMQIKSPRGKIPLWDDPIQSALSEGDTLSLLRWLPGRPKGPWRAGDG